MKILLVLLLIALPFCLYLTGCNKSDNPATPLVITSFSPTADTVGAKVIITGTGFNTSATSNTVKFNGVAATVESATAETLTVRVPESATTGNISVTVGSQTITSGSVFTVLGPTITGFFPLLTGIGYEVVIKGQQFSADISSNTVKINGATAMITKATDTALTIIVPDQATTGKITVTVKGQMLSSSTDIRIKKLTVTTIAGSGNNAFADGTGTNASFNVPWGLGGDGNGNYYIADWSNARIRKVTSAGVVTTLAGDGIQGGMGGALNVARFGIPADVAVDKNGNIFVSDLGWNNIRKITPTGFVSTIAGDPVGFRGYTDGLATASRFSAPLGMAIDANDNIFVVDADNLRIRKITPNGDVSTFAGSGVAGSADGTGTAASFKYPLGLGIDGNGNLFLPDAGNQNIRKITPAGVVTTYAGIGTAGAVDGPAMSASFNNLVDIVVDKDGNLIVTDQLNQKIRIVTPDGYVGTIGGNGVAGTIDGVGHAAGFNFPMGITIDASGAIFMIDNGSATVRKIVIE